MSRPPPRFSPRTSTACLLDSASAYVGADTSRTGKIGAKIRNARIERVPYMLVIGQREAEEGTVSVRHRNKDDLGAKPLEEFIAEITTRSL